VTREVILAFAVLYPLTYFAVHIPASLLNTLWSKDVSPPVRCRLYFAAIASGGWQASLS
jgi:hypothetical protein